MTRREQEMHPRAVHHIRVKRVLFSFASADKEMINSKGRMELFYVFRSMF